MKNGVRNDVDFYYASYSREMEFDKEREAGE